MLSKLRNIQIPEEKTVYVWEDNAEMLMAGKINEHKFEVWCRREEMVNDPKIYNRIALSIMNSMAYWEQKHELYVDGDDPLRDLKGFVYPTLQSYPIKPGPEVIL